MLLQYNAGRACDKTSRRKSRRVGGLISSSRKPASRFDVTASVTSDVPGPGAYSLPAQRVIGGKISSAIVPTHIDKIMKYEAQVNKIHIQPLYSASYNAVLLHRHQDLVLTLKVFVYGCSVRNRHPNELRNRRRRKRNMLQPPQPGDDAVQPCTPFNG